MKIEILCMENKQPTPASSEGSASIFLYSPQLKTPAPASPSHRYYLFPVNFIQERLCFDPHLLGTCRRTSGPMRRAKGGWTPEEVCGSLVSQFSTKWISIYNA